MAVAMLFMQGWRVSEVLGLAWADLDLDGSEPTARVFRAVVLDVPAVLPDASGGG